MALLYPKPSRQHSTGPRSNILTSSSTCGYALCVGPHQQRQRARVAQSHCVGVEVAHQRRPVRRNCSVQGQPDAARGRVGEMVLAQSGREEGAEDRGKGGRAVAYV